MRRKLYLAPPRNRKWSRGTLKLFWPKTASGRESGVIMVMYILLLSVMLEFCSLAVDFGHLVLVQTQIRNAADAAGHAAAQQLVGSGTATQQISAARTAAEQVAAENQVDGQPMVLLDSDISVGNWDTTKTPNFSTTRTPLNAAQVTAHCDTTHSNPISMMFAGAIGFSSIGVAESTTAVNENYKSPYGFAGLNSVTFGSIGVLASIHGDIVSNGTISIGQPLGLGVTVSGNAQSTGGSVGVGVLACVSGSTSTLTQSLVYPTPTLPASNDNGQIASYLDSQNNFTAILGADIPSGTYVVNNLDFLAGIAVNLQGPTTFYVSGQFDMAAAINLLGSCNTDPNNLNVIVMPGGQVNFLANLLTPIAMNIYAPQCPITIAVGVNQYTSSIIGSSLNIALPVLGSFVEVKPNQESSYTAVVQ